MKHNIRFLARAGVIAALYLVLTAFSAVLGLSSGAIQVRLSEALCILPLFSVAAIPGITVGCLLSNLLLGGTVYDVFLGTVATLIGTLCCRCLRKLPLLAPIPTIVSNTLIIPLVLVLSGTGTMQVYPVFMGMIAVGECIACGLLGSLLLIYLRKHPKICRLLFE